MGGAICGSVRRECLDHLLILPEKQLQRVLRAYVDYFNRARPHQGIRQQIPERYGEPVPLNHQRGKILALQSWVDCTTITPEVLGAEGCAN